MESYIEETIDRYSPENTALRNFYKEGQIEPLGINGEGLLKLLKVIQSKSDEQRQEIHACLQLFDWYDELEIPKDLSTSEDKVTITDRYLTQVFDPRRQDDEDDCRRNIGSSARCVPRHVRRGHQ